MDLVFDLLFRPLARLCMARGIRFADAAERLRRAYVDMALGSEGGDATDSKLSVLTGLQRRDVARLRKEPRAAAPAPDPRARLIALWRARHDGAPLPLHGAGSFDELAWDIRRDIHPSALRTALLEAGAIGLEEDRVILLQRAFVPDAGSAAQLDYLARNVGDHLDVAVGNVLGAPEQFDLAVHYDGLSADAAAELEALWRARMAPVLDAINARAAELQDAKPGAHRIRGGGYFKTGEDA